MPEAQGVTPGPHGGDLVGFLSADHAPKLPDPHSFVAPGMVCRTDSDGEAAVAGNVDRDVNHGLRERFADVHSQYLRLRSGLGELQERLAALRVTERSDDGHVTVVVGPRGQVISVDLDAGIYRDRDVALLSRTITQTIHRATASATEATQELVRAYLPPGSGAVDYLRDGDFGALLRRSDAALVEGTERHV